MYCIKKGTLVPGALRQQNNKTKKQRILITIIRKQKIIKRGKKNMNKNRQVNMLIVNSRVLKKCSRCFSQVGIRKVSGRKTRLIHENGLDASCKLRTSNTV